MVILAIDLGKTKSLFCWFDTADQSHTFKTAFSSPATFATLLVERRIDRVVIEVCDMAGWVMDLCQAHSIPIQIANVNDEGWRWKNVKNKTDKKDGLKLARLSAMNDLKLVHLPQRPVRQWRSLILFRHKLQRDDDPTCEAQSSRNEVRLQRVHGNERASPYEVEWDRPMVHGRTTRIAV